MEVLTYVKILSIIPFHCFSPQFDEASPPINMSFKKNVGVPITASVENTRRNLPMMPGLVNCKFPAMDS